MDESEIKKKKSMADYLKNNKNEKNIYRTYRMQLKSQSEKSGTFRNFTVKKAE